ncbi:enoyl-CoA hydratase/isomerase family protein [Marinovum sp. 2_MG-2023]|uniref:enoyl-CoA hydratase/isomerase family protein n=1 Tax=unclassified Marinovum TaxID=2647166 RepID=UPI0026E34D21|nr:MULTISPECIES: enoyl-CoA hydratase/isomerase family protein [unclassified Marinovum]MDO6731432.1 enoyl-CoA hydratase/isomerase family protein [Marinovum sp. 2_MG-2023]MDO6780792.1 enoyl-CoA hydratase/isomerase family protein [Marinovum sp. 1_MG-2023]
MSEDVVIRKSGRAGHITLDRPDALNALTAGMSITIEIALDDWRDDDAVDLVILDAKGTKAFCAGGDIAKLYADGRAGNFDLSRAFWRQEYRLNLKIARYAKPVVAFMQGFTMGGGVGLGGHASHRIVGDSSKIAMPECGIGLIPDVGGSYLLGRAPGETGAYLGLTGARMGAADAIYAGFADHYVPEDTWDDLKSTLLQDGDVAAIAAASQPPTGGILAARQSDIDRLFSAETLSGIDQALAAEDAEFSQAARKNFTKGAPLALACALRAIRAARGGTLSEALAREFRFAYRSQEQGDLIEGIRAQIIDRDFTPKWRHENLDVAEHEIAEMLADLGPFDWTPTGDTP